MSKVDLLVDLTWTSSLWFNALTKACPIPETSYSYSWIQTTLGSGTPTWTCYCKGVGVGVSVTLWLQCHGFNGGRRVPYLYMLYCMKLKRATWNGRNIAWFVDCTLQQTYISSLFVSTDCYMFLGMLHWLNLHTCVSNPSRAQGLLLLHVLYQPLFHHQVHVYLTIGPGVHLSRLSAVHVYVVGSWSVCTVNAQAPSCQLYKIVVLPGRPHHQAYLIIQCNKKRFQALQQKQGIELHHNMISLGLESGSDGTSTCV